MLSKKHLFLYLALRNPNPRIPNSDFQHSEFRVFLMSLLEIEHLSVSYLTGACAVRAVRDVSLHIDAGESLALVGETGSGKSTLALAVLGLLEGPGAIAEGEIRMEGTRLTPDGSLSRTLRGRRVGMVFQDARGSLNPVLTIGSQLTEVLRAHQDLSRKDANAAAQAVLGEVGIPEPGLLSRCYPAELSGGMCQRAAIALAICNRPALLIADEPTSALDPSIQAQILALLRRLQDQRRLALLLISHDLALVSGVAERVAVMYHGNMIETGRTEDVFRRPAHPYTSLLLACRPDLEHRWDQSPLAAIPGSIPTDTQGFRGCSFAPRCRIAETACSESVPPALKVRDGHWASCFKPVGPVDTT
ncbi:MAG: transporter ATP-binding protein [Acidobacteria bacterium]|nr:transporter ATP-binding protein [Acidobacteriota bacterium]